MHRTDNNRQHTRSQLPQVAAEVYKCGAHRLSSAKRICCVLRASFAANGVACFRTLTLTDSKRTHAAAAIFNSQEGGAPYRVQTPTPHSTTLTTPLFSFIQLALFAYQCCCHRAILQAYSRVKIKPSLHVSLIALRTSTDSVAEAPQRKKRSE